MFTRRRKKLWVYVKVALIYLKDIYVDRGHIKPLYASISLFIEEGGEQREFDPTDAF